MLYLWLTACLLPASVAQRDQQCLVDVDLPSGPLSAGAVDGDGVLALGGGPLQLAPVAAVGQAPRLAEEAEDLVAAAVLARHRRRAGHAPDRVLGDHLVEGAGVAAAERGEDAPDVVGGVQRLALERSHREAVALELGVVVLGQLLRPRPDDGLTGRVDLRRERHALVVVDARDRGGERERDAVEGVVVVVQDDHAPRVARAGARALALALARRRQRDAHAAALTASRRSR